MGQSTYHGALPQAVIDALENQHDNLDDLNNLAELPEGTHFLGYLILLHDTEEFLHETTDSQQQSRRKFVESPHQAYRFKTFDEAHRLTRYHSGESIVALFDIGDDQLLVAQLHDWDQGDSHLVH